MKKTKIVCTLGPATSSREVIQSLFENGMNVARINSSFATLEDIENFAKTVRSVSEDIALLMDTEGHKIRLNKFENPINISAGQIIKVDTEPGSDLYIDYPTLTSQIHEGQTILVDDGILSFSVDKIEGKSLYLKSFQEGILKPRKTVAIPNSRLDFPVLSKKDELSIKKAIEEDYDFIALSFVRNTDDIKAAEKITQGSDLKIISKIEDGQGVENFDKILEMSEGIMVARGDLSVEIPQEDVPLLQKEFIKKCNAYGKPVIVATQILESMVNSRKPTRAEVNDAANAILDGADALMLSAETSMGKYPVEAVQTLSQIAAKVEKYITPLLSLDQDPQNAMPITAAITQAVANICKKLPIKSILVATSNGNTARTLSRYKMEQPIFAFTKDKHSKNRLLLTKGIYPFISFANASSIDTGLQDIAKEAIKKELVNTEDLVVIVSGANILNQGATNLIEIQKVQKFIKEV